MAQHQTRRMRGFEENAIAFLLGTMVLLTFANVCIRYLFNLPAAFAFEAWSGLTLPHTILWAQEVVLYLFAWLVIFGISHTFRVTANLGVDALTQALPRRGRRAAALISAAACLIYALLMLKGAWDYWAPFAGLDETTGRWFPTGINWKTRDRAFYVTEQIPMPHFLDFLAAWINQGEVWDKLPRVFPYLILPLGMGLVLIRLVQASWGILTGTRSSLIVSHEAEDDVRAAAPLNHED
jgi:C4-dicarboxylate transporter DctQ subunit